MSNKNDFLKYQAQISKTPLLINVKKATGSYVYDDNNKRYIDLVKNLGFLSSEIFKKQYESLIDNNLGKLIKRGIVKINNEKIYCLTAHGDDLWLKYNKDWFSMPPLNKQYIKHD